MEKTQLTFWINGKWPFFGTILLSEIWGGGDEKMETSTTSGHGTGSSFASHNKHLPEAEKSPTCRILLPAALVAHYGNNNWTENAVCAVDWIWRLVNNAKRAFFLMWTFRVKLKFKLNNSDCVLFRSGSTFVSRTIIIDFLKIGFITRCFVSWSDEPVFKHLWFDFSFKCGN